MAKGFTRLSDEELKFLDGKISIIDLQKGCPVQCIICGVDAPKPKGNMPWKDLVDISDSILDVKDTKKRFHRTA